MRSLVGRVILGLCLMLAVPAAGRATDVDGPDCQHVLNDFGDAPEGVQAYPGVMGHFPTCLAAGPPGDATSACGAVLPIPGLTGFVRHIHPAGVSYYWLGCSGAAAPEGIDDDADGKTNDTGAPLSACGGVPVDCTELAFGMTFGQDEFYGSTDAGLAASLTFFTCSPNSFTFKSYNCGGQRQVLLNVLVDWNHDGDWNDEVACTNLPAGCVSEWAVKNVPITLVAGCNTITTPVFPGGPTVGGGWMRITISDNPVQTDFTWNGSASVAGQSLLNGETEDYPVRFAPAPQGCLDYQDWGDAPEGVQAYPGGIIGHFPTCSAPAATAGSAEIDCIPPRSTPPSAADVAGFVRHVVSATAPQGFWLGCGDGTAANPGVDSESDGKMNDTGAPGSACLATLLTDCTEFLGLNWGQDECYGDLDAGLVTPTNLIFKTCQPATFDFRTFNCKQQADAFLNVLVDMNQDGDWNDNFQCPGTAGCAYEWAVKNQVIVVNPGCELHTTPSFLMGPKDGLGWMRITLTSAPVPDDFPWRGSTGPNGDGFFSAGETEDYPVVIRNQNVGVGTEDDFTRLAFSPLVPNPAKSQVMMRFTLPQRSDVSLAAFDVAGRKLAEIIDGRLEAGEHRIAWDFTDHQGRAVAAGYYLVKLRVGDRVLTQRGIRVR
jgi:hypothetical protein